MNNVRDDFTDRRTRIDCAVERNESPALLLCPRHESREVDHAARQAIELGHDESVGLPRLSSSSAILIPGRRRSFAE